MIKRLTQIDSIRRASLMMGTIFMIHLLRVFWSQKWLDLQMMEVLSDLEPTTLKKAVERSMLPQKVQLNGLIANLRDLISSPKHTLNRKLVPVPIHLRRSLIDRLETQPFQDRNIKPEHLLVGSKMERKRILVLSEITLRLIKTRKKRRIKFQDQVGT